jgi:cytidylate kinase
LSDDVFIITISGDLGSGKSVLAERLAKHYNANRYSTGTAQRQLAAEMGITTLELNQRAESDKTIDDKIDGVFKSLAQTDINLIVDSRMAWHFLPNSFKIKLEVAPQIAADRISKDNTRIGEGDTSPDVILQSILDRRASEKERFLRYYDADITANENYDLVVNTYGAEPNDIAKRVIDCVNKWREGQNYHNYWMAPSIIDIKRTDSKPLDDGETFAQIKHDGPDVYAVKGHNLVAQASGDNTPLIEVVERV